MPVFLLLVILFTVWFTYERKKSSSQSAAASDGFWSREHEASFARKQSTDDICFLVLDEELIPDPESDDELAGITDRLHSLASSEIADLSGLTNTDLKLRWGIANFERLSEADDRFITLTGLIADCCDRLSALGRSGDAAPLLRFAYDNNMRISRIVIAYASLAAEVGDLDLLKEITYTALDDPSCPQSLADRLRILLNNTMNP